jgi:hypothetical protein
MPGVKRGRSMKRRGKPPPVAAEPATAEVSVMTSISLVTSLRLLSASRSALSCWVMAVMAVNLRSDSSRRRW